MAKSKTARKLVIDYFNDVTDDDDTRRYLRDVTWTDIALVRCLMNENFSFPCCFNVHSLLHAFLMCDKNCQSIANSK